MNDLIYGNDIVQTLRYLVLGIATSLVDHPDRVDVVAREDVASTTLILKVSSDDLGRVIGKQGRTARSIKTILNAASVKAGHNFQLDIAETP